jgi:hypothetical protein
MIGMFASTPSAQHANKARHWRQLTQTPQFGDNCLRNSAYQVAGQTQSTFLPLAEQYFSSQGVPSFALRAKNGTQQTISTMLPLWKLLSISWYSSAPPRHLLSMQALVAAGRGSALA